MTIDDIKHCLLTMIDCEVCEECNLYGTTGADHCEHDCVDGALHIIDKYQEIKQIYDNWLEVNDFSYNQAMQKIGKVLEDGNDYYPAQNCRAELIDIIRADDNEVTE